MGKPGRASFCVALPIFTSLLLPLFPILALKFARPLLANLLDLNGLQAVAVTVTACVTSWTALITAWMVVSYGPARYEFKAVSVLSIPEIPPWKMFVLACLLTLPLLASAGFYSVRELATTRVRFLAGVAGGYSIAALLALSGWLALRWESGIRKHCSVSPRLFRQNG
ncbi:MAG: hypothetical protein ACJ74Z_03595 [Bryobacteraceae bacterium]